MLVFQEPGQNMSNFQISHKLILGILGGLYLLSDFTLPSRATINPKPHLSVSELNIERNHHYIALSWGEIWDKLKRQKVAGGSRGNLGDLCLISPNTLVNTESSENSYGKYVTIWHQNPLFMWQSGSISKIILKNDAGVQWEKTLEPSSRYIFYDGKPLELGKTYKLIVFAPHETELYQIKVVNSEQHQQITADLLTKPLEAKGVNPEEIALVKANYFLERQMWSDVLWELYSIPNPTDKLKTTLEQVNNHNFCNLD